MNTLATVLQTISVILIASSIASVAYLFIQIAVENVADWLAARRRRRIARIEADLDARQAELRRTILSLAEQLAAERVEASQQMTRAAVLTSGTTPPPG